MTELADRLEFLVERLRTAYDGIGHSSGRPYVYFVYPPDQERALLRLADEYLHDDATLRFHHVDLLRITIDTLANREERSRQLLEDPARRAGAAESILRMWARAVGKVIGAGLVTPGGDGRPVVVLRGLAALLQELTGLGLEEWVRRQFFPRHVRQFKYRPIAWHLTSVSKGGGGKRGATRQAALECLVYYLPRLHWRRAGAPPLAVSPAAHSHGAASIRGRAQSWGRNRRSNGGGAHRRAGSLHREAPPGGRRGLRLPGAG